MTQQAKLKWHCRRGMRELDLLLEGFLEHRFQSLSPTDQDAFERLLDCPNQDLMDWLMEGHTPQDERFAGLVRQIRERTLPDV